MYAARMVGKMGDKQAIPVLKQLIENEEKGSDINSIAAESVLMLYLA